MGCEGCWEKQQKIDSLQQRIQHLEGQLATQKRKETEGYFGSSTPSSKKPFKENRSPESPRKNGGGKPGHPGHGRRGFSEAEADVVESCHTSGVCPSCGGELTRRGVEQRSIIDTGSTRAQKKVVQCDTDYCRVCGKTVKAKPAVLPKSLYGNMLTAQACILHFLHGIPVGRLEEQWGALVTNGVLFKIFQRVSRYWEPAYDALIKAYRQAPVVHADETGWRTDGASGYAWIFCTADTSIFQFRSTRSSEVPKQVFGPDPLDGTLVVDRYSGYNKLPIQIQYCYAHLLRTVEDLGTEFDQHTEVQKFVSDLAAPLAEAMQLHTKDYDDPQYYQEAGKLKTKITDVINADAQHLGIRNIQDIFRANTYRLYHWAVDRRVPAHNNRAEQSLRSTVIARKVSFGSQSAAGAHARSVLMTVLHTARKRLRGGSVESWFKDCLDHIATDKTVDTSTLLPKPFTDTS